MKHLKPLLAFVFPLIMMLSSFSIYLLVNKMVNNYKQNITSDYSIIVVSSKQINKVKDLPGIKIANIEQIDRNKIIGDIKNSLSKSSLSSLNKKLPYFIKLYLEEFPTTNELESLNNKLMKLDYVNNVEIFESEHTKVYSLLVLTKNIVTVLFIIVLVSSFLMLLQQIRIWFFEYSEEISILQLLGASLLYSTKFILKIIVTSIIISIIIVFGLMFLLIVNNSSIAQQEILSIMPTIYDMGFESVMIIVLALIIPIIAYGALIIKHRNSEDV
jgi:cell division transport system permease protein